MLGGSGRNAGVRVVSSDLSTTGWLPSLIMCSGAGRRHGPYPCCGLLIGMIGRRVLTWIPPTPPAFLPAGSVSYGSLKMINSRSVLESLLFCRQWGTRGDDTIWMCSVVSTCSPFPGSKISFLLLVTITRESLILTFKTKYFFVSAKGGHTHSFPDVHVFFPSQSFLQHPINAAFL